MSVSPIIVAYSAAGLAFAFLSVLLIVSRRFSWPFNYLLAASLLMCVWAVLMVRFSFGVTPVGALIALDGLHAFAALLFAGQLVGRQGATAWQRSFLWLPWLIPPLAIALFIYSTRNPTDGFQVAYYFIVALTIAGLLSAEQIYRNADKAKRAVATLVALALATIFVFDFYLYSSGILLGNIDRQLWIARGFVNAMVVPVLALALRRDPDWQSGFFVSRHVVFYSASVVGIGVYLILVALGGAFMQNASGSLGVVLQVVFFVASLLLLILVLFSQTVRRRLKVFLATHFYANRYDYREQWLNLIRRLAQDSSRAPMPNLCLEALADVIESDGGVLWLRRDQTGDDFDVAAVFGSFAAAHALQVTHPILAFMQEHGWVIDGAEAAENPEHYQNAFVALPDDVMAPDRIFVPLVLDGDLIGAAGLFRPAGMPALNYEDHDLLRTVGQQLAVFLQRDRNREMLAEAREFAVFNRFTAFIMHDLKNLIAQQSLVVANAEKHKTNPAFVDDAINTIANSVKRMQKLLEQLQAGDQRAQARPVALAALLGAVIDEASIRRPAPRLEVDDDVTVMADPEKLATVVGHLIRNGQESIESVTGDVVVHLVRRNNDAVIEITDTGCGMDQTFIQQQLFKPFESTKGAKGMGIGAYQAKDYIEQIGGSISVSSVPREGTTFTIRLPSS